jgi:hypothetical protein
LAENRGSLEGVRERGFNLGGAKVIRIKWNEQKIISNAFFYFFRYGKT